MEPERSSAACICAFMSSTDVADEQILSSVALLRTTKSCGISISVCCDQTFLVAFIRPRSSDHGWYVRIARRIIDPAFPASVVIQAEAPTVRGTVTLFDRTWFSALRLDVPHRALLMTRWLDPPRPHRIRVQRGR